jgi:predicted enzyme related to lactoylglutathione lyase
MPIPYSTFVWYELMTTDTPAAETFYRSILGWTGQDSGVPGVAYTMLSAGETPVAGLMAIPPDARAAGARPGWLGYVAVDNVDTIAAQAKEAGGVIHRPAADIPGVGRFAILADPQGAMFALFTPLPGEPRQPVTPGTPGHGGWRELLATDREAAFDFYSGLFGWTKAEPFDMGPMGIYQLFNAGSDMIGGMMTKPEAVPAPSWLYYFNVAGIDEAAERVKKAGGQVTNGPNQVPGGSWIIHCVDPQGALFALVGPRT